MFEFPYGWEELFSFRKKFSWDYLPIFLFSGNIEFFDNDLLKLSLVGIIHGSRVVEVVHVVACGKL